MLERAPLNALLHGLHAKQAAIATVGGELSEALLALGARVLPRGPGCNAADVEGVPGPAAVQERQDFRMRSGLLTAFDVQQAGAAERSEG